MHRNSLDAMAEVAKVLSGIRDPELMEGLLRSVLTRNEVKEISGRWQLVKMLEEGYSQRQIARELGMSLCKITRGSRELKKENSPLKRVMNKHYNLRGKRLEKRRK
ncbi:Trp family transcriptional regulator [Acidobacteriota bacterium]